MDTNQFVQYLQQKHSEALQVEKNSWASLGSAAGKVELLEQILTDLENEGGVQTPPEPFEVGTDANVNPIQAIEDLKEITTIKPG